MVLPISPHPRHCQVDPMSTCQGWPLISYEVWICTWWLRGYLSGQPTGALCFLKKHSAKSTLESSAVSHTTVDLVLLAKNNGMVKEYVCFITEFDAI